MKNRNCPIPNPKFWVILGVKNQKYRNLLGKLGGKIKTKTDLEWHDLWGTNPGCGPRPRHQPASCGAPGPAVSSGNWGFWWVFGAGRSPAAGRKRVQQKKLDKPKTADNHACTHTRTRVGGHARTRTLSHAQTQMQEHQRLLQPSIILCKQHSSSAPVHQLSPPSPLVVYVFWALPQILCQGRWPLGTSVGCKGEKKSGRTKHWVAVVPWMQCRRLPSIRMFFWPVTNIKPFVVGGGGNVTLAKRGENAQIEKHTNPQ